MCETLLQNPQKAPGFRFSATDAVAIVVAGGATVLLRNVLGALTWLLPIVLGHFFLFCNVFRVRRSYELMWAGAFILNFCAWRLLGRMDWPAILVVQAPVTLLCIGAEIGSSRYHGIGHACVRRRRSNR